MQNNEENEGQIEKRRKDKMKKRKKEETKRKKGSNEKIGKCEIVENFQYFGLHTQNPLGFPGFVVVVLDAIFSRDVYVNKPLVLIGRPETRASTPKRRPKNATLSGEKTLSVSKQLNP